MSNRAVFNRARSFALPISVLLITLAAVGIYGCRSALQGQDLSNRRVVARIDNYKMSVEDFKSRVELILASKYLSIEPNEAKEELLDELVTRNVLIQEAQRQDLDKGIMFMREIERYWEQSLLKLLLKKKSEEISETIAVEDSEVIDEYTQMKRRIFAQLVIFNERSAAQRLSDTSDDNFEKVKESLKEKIVSGELPKWWVLGDLPQYLQEPLFSLKAKQSSPPVKCGNNWAVMKLIKEEKIDTEPFENVSMAIRKNIHKRKKEQALEQWIKDLRKNVTIKIDQKVLGAINLE